MEFGSEYLATRHERARAHCYAIQANDRGATLDLARELAKEEAVAQQVAASDLFGRAGYSFEHEDEARELALSVASDVGRVSDAGLVRRIENALLRAHRAGVDAS